MIMSLRAEVVGERSRTALEARYISKQNHPSSASGFVNCDNNRGLRWSVSKVELLSKPVMFLSKTTLRVPCSLGLVEVQGSRMMRRALGAEVVGEQSRTALVARYVSKQNHPSSTLFAELGRSAGFDNDDNVSEG